MSELKQLTERCEAIVQGAGAVTYLAQAVVVLRWQMELMKAGMEGDKGACFATTADHAERVRKALHHISEAMNVLGDILNASDACDEESGLATAAAFRRVRKALKAVRP